MPKAPRKGQVRRALRPPQGVDAVLYTDGSHIKGTPKRGYGACLRYMDKEYVLSGTADLSDPAAASNPTMELRAAAVALERLRQVRPRRLLVLRVCADYIGVVKYGNGEWKGHKAKVPHFRAEAERLERAAAALRLDVDVKFEHVRGHSGDVGNDRADELARSGATQDTFGDLQN